jgi:putative endonuclease
LKPSTRTTGNAGEKLAIAWLGKKGFTILDQNYYGPYGEIDIVAQKNGVLHFIEVKTRLTSNYGTPLESLTHQKIQRIRKTVYRYLEEKHPVAHDVQIDFIGIRKGLNGRFFLSYIPQII